jgi:TolB-like protein/Tfp pilus assembly protein PilF
MSSVQMRDAADRNQESVRAQLERILASSVFRNSENPSRFLRFVVEHTLMGEANQLKEYRIGVEVFGRSPSYDPRTNPVVRLEARRLRAKLEQYYHGEGLRDPIRIDMPKGGYAISVATAASLDRGLEFPRSQSSTAARRGRFGWFASPGDSYGKWKLVVALALIMAAGAAFYWRYAQLLRPNPDPPSLAVLPFLNLTGNSENDYLSDGITDEITGSIAKSEGLRVVARTSAFQFKGKSEDVRAIAKRLGVSSILEGSVQSQGGRLLVTAQLVRASDGYHLWSDTYEREFKDVFAVEDQITRALSDALRARLLTDAESNGKEQKVDPIAHQLYLRGQYMRQRLSPDDVKQAISDFNQAVDHDPLYAEAYAALAGAYATQGANAWTDSREVYPKARAAAEHAMALDPKEPDAHAVLANITFFYNWDFPGAEREFKQAIRFNPNSAAAHQWYGILLYYSRRFDEAREQFRLAKELSPLAIQIDMTMVMLYEAERSYDAAIELARRVVSEHDNYLPHALLGLLYADEKRYQEAIAEGQKAVALAGNQPDIILVLANLYAQSGQRDTALAILRDVLANKNALVPPFTVAGVYAELGDQEQMYQWLDKGIEQRSPACLKLNIAEAFDAYRSEPHFQDVLRRVGLPSQ